MNPTNPRLGYRPALDGLRAVAVLLVMGHHTGKLLLPGTGLGRRLLPGGFLGVDVFFVLSGFLITALLLERRGERSPVGAFYGRRALRLMPAVLALLAGVVGIALLEHERGAEIVRTLWTVPTYSANWSVVAGTFPERHVAHLWSLSVEAQFYVVWPLLLLGALALGWSRRRVLVAVGVLIVAVAVWRAILWEPGYRWLSLYIRTDTRADALLIGAALALAPWERLVASSRLALAGAAALAAIVVCAMTVDPPSRVYYLGLLTVVAALSAVTIASLLPGSGPLARGLARAPVVAIGRWSYSLYLWHFPMFVVVADHAGSWPAALRVLVAWTFAFVLAVFSYRFVERPALALRRLRAEPARHA